MAATPIMVGNAASRLAVELAVCCKLIEQVLRQLEIIVPHFPSIFNRNFLLHVFLGNSIKYTAEISK